MDGLLTKLERYARRILDGSLLDWLPWVLLALLALTLIAFLRTVLPRRRKGWAGGPADPSGMDISALGEHGPPPGAAVLELQGMPVRLAAVILAPAGGARRLPSFHQIPGVFEAILRTNAPE